MSTLEFVPFNQFVAELFSSAAPLSCTYPMASLISNIFMICYLMSNTVAIFTHLRNTGT